MLPVDHDPSALRAALTANFAAVSRDAKLKSQVEQVFEQLMESTRRILLDQLCKWNENRSITSVLPEELLASCFAFLPFRDRFTASHVSRAWRNVSQHYPSVWSELEISADYSGLMSLLDLALSRSGDCPIDLRIWTWFEGCDVKLRSGLPRLIHRQMHRMRTLETCQTVVLDDPMPLLERVDGYYISLSSRCLELCASFGRLHTLHVRLCFLPTSFKGSIDSVRELEASLRLEDDDSQVGMLPHLFAKFPRMESFALTEILEEQMPRIPRGPVPPSLTRLRLSVLPIEAPSVQDLVALYSRWTTPQLRQVEVCGSPSTISDEPSVRTVRQFFARAVELSIIDFFDELDLLTISSKDAAGGTRTLELYRGDWAYEARPQERRALAAWLSIGQSCALLRSVQLAAEELNELINLGGCFPSVPTVGIYLEESIPHGGESASDNAVKAQVTWSSLAVLSRLPSSFPALESCFLDTHARSRWDKHAHDACARALLDEMVVHAVPGLPVLHIRGISREGIAAIDPHDLERLSVQLEFDLS